MKRYIPLLHAAEFFAKSDIQPLINQGARKEDIAASIFYAVVNQTIAGLAQGREIKGNILYLGGPLTFMSGLREAFDDVLKCKGLCPEKFAVFCCNGRRNVAVRQAVQCQRACRNDRRVFVIRRL